MPLRLFSLERFDLFVARVFRRLVGRLFAAHLQAAKLALQEVAKGGASAGLRGASLTRGIDARRILTLRLELHILGHLAALGCAEAERAEAIVLVETHDLRRDDLASLEDILGLDRHIGADLAARDKALDALLE